MATLSRQQAQRERELAILREVVESHAATGAPVGSRSVAERLGGRLSSATIRAVMNRLGQRDLLVQPHTSSGRVPTDSGYREYLDHVLEVGQPTPPDRRSVVSLDWGTGQTVSALLQEAARLLANSLGVAGLVAAPKLEQARLHHIEFVWLRAGNVLAIVVTDAGVVHERLLPVDPELQRDELEPLRNYLNSFLPGLTLGSVRARLEEEQQRDRAELSDLEAQAIELGARALEDAEGTDLVVDGAAHVLEMEEFNEPQRAAELVRSLDRRELWLAVLDEIVSAEDIKVYVGSEMGRPGLNDCSLIVAGYRELARPGLVAALGSRRLDYRRAIPLVRLVASRLTQLLSFGEDS